MTQAKSDRLAGVDFASDEAAEAANDANLQTGDFAEWEPGGANGFTKADVRAIAKARDAELESDATGAAPAARDGAGTLARPAGDGGARRCTNPSCVMYGQDQTGLVDDRCAHCSSRTDPAPA